MEPGCQQWQCSVSLSFLKLKQAFYVTWGWGIHVRVDAIWMRISQQLWKGNSLRNHYKLLFLLCFFFFSSWKKWASFMKRFCSISFEVDFFMLCTLSSHSCTCVKEMAIAFRMLLMQLKKIFKKNLSVRLICCFFILDCSSCQKGFF